MGTAPKDAPEISVQLYGSYAHSMPTRSVPVGFSGSSALTANSVTSPPELSVTICSMSALRCSGVISARTALICSRSSEPFFRPMAMPTSDAVAVKPVSLFLNGRNVRLSSLWQTEKAVGSSAM